MRQQEKRRDAAAGKEEKKTTAAIVLAAGSGKRMGSSTRKQYLPLGDKPLLYYSLKAFQQSFVDHIVLVTAKEDISYCREEIVNRYGLDKVTVLVPGGKERYHSVAAGIQAAPVSDYLFIHDGARPMLTGQILERAFEAVKRWDACVVGMPVKDTIKIADGEGNISATPDRRLVWMVQTPQVFAYDLIKKAYEKLLAEESLLAEQGIMVTDDAMVVETFMGHRIKLIPGSYENIKITTPEDLKLAQCLMQDL